MAFQAGSARANITPFVGTPMAGFAAREGVAQGIHDELFAKALVVSDGAESAVMIAADLIGLSAETVAEIREKVSESTGVPARSIMVSASHTHSGPAVVNGYGKFGMAAEHYRKTLVDDLAGAAISAWSHRVQARSGWTSIDLHGVGVNRRSPDGLPVDPAVSVLKVEAVDGRFTTILMNYTCHAVTLGPKNLLISADYPGYATRTVEGFYGERATAMFTNGAAGDINTGHSAALSALGYDIPGRTFERAESLGRRLAGAVLTATELVAFDEEPVIRSSARKLELGRKALPDLSDANEDLEAKRSRLRELEAGGASEADITQGRIDELYASLLVRRIEELGEDTSPSSIEIEVQGIRLGSAVVVAIPVELFVQIGLRVKGSAPCPHTVVCGYTNGSYGYLPSKEAFEAGGYEAVSSRFAPEAAERVEGAMLDLTRELWHA